MRRKVPALLSAVALLGFMRLTTSCASSQPAPEPAEAQKSEKPADGATGNAAKDGGAAKAPEAAAAPEGGGNTMEQCKKMHKDGKGCEGDKAAKPAAKAKPKKKK